MTEETDKEIDDVEFLKQIEVSDADIANVKSKIDKRKNPKYVLTPARIAQQQAMRKRAWEVKRERKAVRDALIQEKLKQYQTQAHEKMKNDIVKTAVRILKQDKAITVAIKRMFSDVNYDDVIYNRLKTLMDGIHTSAPQNNPSQNTAGFNRALTTFV